PLTSRRPCQGLAVWLLAARPWRNSFQETLVFYAFLSKVRRQPPPTDLRSKNSATAEFTEGRVQPQYAFHGVQLWTEMTELRSSTMMGCVVRTGSLAPGRLQKNIH